VDWLVLGNFMPGPKKSQREEKAEQNESWAFFGAQSASTPFVSH